MKSARTGLFKRDYKKLPEKIKKRADKSLYHLATNPSHPSLRMKKIKSMGNIWEARITKKYRFSFQIINDTYVLRRIGKHDKVLKKT